MAKKRLPKKVKNTYMDYKRKFLTARENLAKRGESMYDNYLLSEAEWEAMNKSFENKYEREIKQGKRENMPNINDVIVKQQTYEYTQKQAELFRQALVREKRGLRTVREIMLGQFDKGLLFDLEETYDELKQSGLSGAEAKLFISQKYFGSK